MSGNDHRDGASPVNPEDDDKLLIPETLEFQVRISAALLALLEALLALLVDWHPVRPRVVPGTVLLRRDVMRAFRITDNTFSAWKAAGLEVCHAAGTKQEIVLADKLIAFLAANPVLRQKGQ